jgi:hypothetical protein
LNTNPENDDYDAQGHFDRLRAMRERELLTMKPTPKQPKPTTEHGHRVGDTERKLRKLIDQRVPGNNVSKKRG